MKLYERVQAQKDRHELLHTRFTTNVEAANANEASNSDDTQIIINVDLPIQRCLIFRNLAPKYLFSKHVYSVFLNMQIHRSIF